MDRREGVGEGERTNDGRTDEGEKERGGKATCSAQRGGTRPDAGAAAAAVESERGEGGEEANYLPAVTACPPPSQSSLPLLPKPLWR